jgi:putative oxidoreductase
VKIGAGVLLALNKFPRVASLALAASIIPTTVAGHPFWEKSDPAEKTGEQQQFLKNVSILGGLILAAVDTEGKPSLGWRGRRAARKLAARTSDLTSQSDGAADKLRDAGDKVRRNVVDGVDVAIGTLAS